MRNVIVTGGSGGLGTELVRRLSSDYHCIVLGHHDVDLTDETSAREAFARIGEVYGLVHLVGGYAPGASFDAWNRMLAVNATAAFLAMQHVQLAKPGRIVAVSSIATLTPSSGSLAYVVAKSALNALVASLAEEHRGKGVTVNAVLPDAMATPAMLKEMDASKLVPLERVCETIAFLLSDAAAGTSGALLPIRA
ncbi:MAG TPA: SDR family NAD(P)-dependent oxidoreductase [Thermoanaerobaculia bacterium]|nr:SDR family NAD(P)-dependent oxidoreductase [Thermoanaerobaculia bacterium]